MTLSIVAFSILIVRIMTLSMLTVRITTLGIMTLTQAQHKNTKNNDA